MPEAEGGVPLPTEAELRSLPREVRLSQAADAAAAASSANNLVDSLRKKASAILSPKERNRLLSEAYDKEIEARGLSKKAKILQSGTFQGAVGGAGIGAATGAGLGTVVGTLVGTVASIPTTAVGGLVGAGTGAVHGPWLMLGGGGGKGEKEKKDGEKGGEGGAGKMVQIPQEAVDSGAVEVNEKAGTVEVKDPEALKSVPGAWNETSQQQTETEAKERRRPRKLEIRSKSQQFSQDPSSSASTAAAAPSKDAPPAKRKPPKLGPRVKQGHRAA